MPLISPALQLDRQRRLELVGPAGAGKSTLVVSVVERLRADTAEIWGLPVTPLLVNGIQLVPAFSRFWLHSGSLLWAETRHMVRLRTLARALRQGTHVRNDLVIFDEGPVFALAWLRAFGHEVFRADVSSEWWATALREWASLIQIVVVLDAPDPLLARRIRSRQIDHEVKQFSDAEVARWMAQFRGGLEWVLAGLSRPGGPSVVRLSSEHATPERIADQLTGVVHAG